MGGGCECGGSAVNFLERLCEGELCLKKQRAIFRQAQYDKRTVCAVILSLSKECVSEQNSINK